MYCNGCGQALVAGQGFCPRCGQANAAGRGAYAPMGYVPLVTPLAIVERRVNALAVGWLVYGGLIAVTGIVGMAFARAAIEGHFGPFGSPFGWHGNHGPMLGLFFLKFGWMALILRVGLAVAAGYGLLQKAPWARVVAIIAAVLSLIHLPFGTVMAVWTLVVLVGARNAAGYDAMAVPRY
jgi:hypothetical protein